MQSEVYKIGAEIARVEQQIQHHKELTEQLQRAREETERAHGELAAHIADDRARHDEVQHCLPKPSRKWRSCAPPTKRPPKPPVPPKQNSPSGRRNGMRTRASLRTPRNRPRSSARISNISIDSLLEADQRRTALDTERAAANLDELAQALQTLEAQHASAQARLESVTRTLDERRGAAESLLERERAQHGVAERQAG